MLPNGYLSLTLTKLIAIAATAGGTQLIVLDLVFAEVVNAIWSRHRGKLMLPEAERALQTLLRVPVQPEPARPLLESALEIGIRYDRAIYDALFVALVKKTGFQGVTADEPLYNAVRADYPTIVLLRDWK